MGKTITPKYRIELSFVSFTARRKEIARFAFMVKEHGAPTVENAKKWRDSMNKSFETHNSHLSKTQSLFSNATIIRQSDGAVVAEYKAPMFEVV